MNGLFERYLKECPAIAILRGITPTEIIDVCDALYEAGIRLLEVPFNSPDAAASIAMAARHCEGRQLVGSGTTLTTSEVAVVARSGGNFVVSPNTDVEVIRATKIFGMVSIPGFFTASEAFTAMKAGADYLKLFPAILGPSYIKSLRAVVKAPILAVGGMDADNIPYFLQVCSGVGIGSALYKAGKPLADVTRDAALMVSTIREVAATQK